MKKDKPLWSSRQLMQSPCYVALCLSDEAFKKVIKKLKIVEPVNFLKTKHADATTHFCFAPDGKPVAVVCLKDTKHDLQQKHALLVHEAVHIWQWIKEIIGEAKPSDEFESYSVQSIAQELFYSLKGK